MNKPELYGRSNSMQRKDATEFLEEYAPKMVWKEKNNKILDIGCGDGGVTNILAKYLPSDFDLLGCDINVNMVNFAIEQNSNTQTSFMVLDIVGEIPEEMKKNFDHVFSFYALHWIQNHNQVFKNVYDLLEENGEFYSIFLGSNPYHQIFRAMSHEAEQYIAPYFDSKEPEKEITKLMENAGFIDVNAKCEDKVYQCDDMHVFKNHFFAVYPFKISNEALENVFEDFIRGLKKVEVSRGIENPPNIVNLYYKLLTVYGHKPPV